jgi:BlaI family penicillinase repressor
MPVFFKGTAIIYLVKSFASRYKFHTMPRQKHSGLTMRERQIMDVLYRRGRATAAEVMADLPGEPTDSTVRTQLRILEQKGQIRHVEENLRYVYEPVVTGKSARQSALAHVVDTFFDGSIQKVMAALLGREPVSKEELDRVEELVKKARKGGRK